MTKAKKKVEKKITKKTEKKDKVMVIHECDVLTSKWGVYTPQNSPVAKSDMKLYETRPLARKARKPNQKIVRLIIVKSH